MLCSVFQSAPASKRLVPFVSAHSHVICELGVKTLCKYDHSHMKLSTPKTVWNDYSPPWPRRTQLYRKVTLSNPLTFFKIMPLISSAGNGYLIIWISEVSSFELSGYGTDFWIREKLIFGFVHKGSRTFVFATASLHVSPCRSWCRMITLEC